jgi:hypothetical protein
VNARPWARIVSKECKEAGSRCSGRTTCGGGEGAAPVIAGGLYSRRKERKKKGIIHRRKASRNVRSLSELARNLAALTVKVVEKLVMLARGWGGTLLHGDLAGIMFGGL